jgi:hypothetical protein
MRKLLIGMGFAVLSQFAGFAWADVLEGDFSDVDYGGNSLTAPATTFIANSAAGSTLQWGTGSVSYGTDYSTLQFFGADVPLEDTTAPVLLGAIVYLNGTSDTDSIISSAKLTFSIDGVTLGADQVEITSTSNLYSNELNLSPAQATNDADYVNICGNGSNICSIGIQAFEDTEGTSGVPFSDPVVAYLWGTYSIDPSITLTDATYVSGDGVVSGRPASSVPEASTWTMLLLGFAGIAFTTRRWGARRSPLTA